MKTAIVTHSWLNDPSHYARVQRWLKWHAHIKRPDWDLVILDNGATSKNMANLLTWATYAPQAAPRVISFSRAMIRDGLAGYEYTWRAFAFMREFMHFWEYDRIIFAESDFFICSERMLRWAETVEGWATVWCPKYRFPESAFFVLTQHCDAYEEFWAERAQNWREPLGRIIETAIPWTSLNRDFIGDRYEGIAPPFDQVDFVAQMGLEFKIPTFWMVNPMPEEVA